MRAPSGLGGALSSATSVVASEAQVGAVRSDGLGAGALVSEAVFVPDAVVCRRDLSARRSGTGLPAFGFESVSVVVVALPFPAATGSLAGRMLDTRLYTPAPDMVITIAPSLSQQRRRGPPTGSRSIVPAITSAIAKSARHARFFDPFR